MENTGLNQSIEKVLVTEQQLKDAVARLAAQINADYGSEPLILAIILKGSLIFASDLMRQLKMPLTIDFMQVSSYGSGTVSKGFINIKKDLSSDIDGQNILIIEDIIDSGNTLAKLKHILKDRGPASVKICSLLSKPSRREMEVEVEYIGRDIPDEFVVGYGLDFDEKYRNLPYIGILKPKVYANI